MLHVTVSGLLKIEVGCTYILIAKKKIKSKIKFYQIFHFFQVFSYFFKMSGYVSYYPGPTG